jgi:hypothetical protein
MERARPINPYCLVFEALNIILFAGALLHAGRQGRFQVMELVWAGVYGFLLEWLSIKQLHAYHYGQFLIMIDDAPLAIALGWAVIIYASMGYSSRIQLPEPARPLLDALIALNIDLALDAVAIRLGMWTWNGVRLDRQWFGVPWANFIAWFVVTWSYSGFVRALRSWRTHRRRQWLYAPLALVLSLITLTATSELYRSVVSDTGINALTPLLLVGGSVIIVLDSQPRVLAVGSPEPIVIAVPIIYHVFGLTAGIGSGIFGRQPVLGVIGVAMLTIGLLVHLLPWWVSRSRLHHLEA